MLASWSPEFHFIEQVSRDLHQMSLAGSQGASGAMSGRGGAGGPQVPHLGGGLILKGGFLCNVVNASWAMVTWDLPGSRQTDRHGGNNEHFPIAVIDNIFCATD